MNYQYKIDSFLAWAGDVLAYALTHPRILRACFTFGKRRMKLVAKKLDIGVLIPYLCGHRFGNVAQPKTNSSCLKTSTSKTAVRQ